MPQKKTFNDAMIKQANPRMQHTTKFWPRAHQNGQQKKPLDQKAKTVKVIEG